MGLLICAHSKLFTYSGLLCLSGILYHWLHKDYTLFVVGIVTFIPRLLVFNWKNFPSTLFPFLISCSYSNSLNGPFFEWPVWDCFPHFHTIYFVPMQCDFLFHHCKKLLFKLLLVIRELPNPIIFSQVLSSSISLCCFLCPPPHLSSICVHGILVSWLSFLLHSLCLFFGLFFSLFLNIMFFLWPSSLSMCFLPVHFQNGRNFYVLSLVI